ncbi:MULTISPECIES: FecR family protein [Butyricimonas]|uniref:FecR family protein n=1 Tax=Butyricimonas TaxID=574697 RepID=UPI0022E64327|nr:MULTISPECIES: FecR domain-containing protein [Butyricimonas]
MDLLKKRLDIARLIAEELTGTIDEKDRVVLARWLDEDERHREEYADILESLKTGNEAWKDQEQGRQLMESRWGAVKSHTVQKTGRWITWSKYAAVIVLFVSIGIFWLVNEEKQEVENGTVAQIEHGSMKAQLVLANGKKVDLRPETSLQLEEVGGTRILTSDDRVKYSGKDSLAGQLAEVKYNTLIVPRGGEFSLELADGTRVWLNAESRLRYPVAFTGKERKVEMEGEVYFEVAKNKEKPFIVTVNGVDIRVLGTSFNVSAYQEDVVTTLVEGKVQLKKGNEQVILSPNQQAIWSDDEFRVKQVDARNYVLWKEGIFYFEDVDLETILDDMARWYNVNVFYMNPALKEMKFSVEIRRYGDINEILRRIGQTKRVKFEIKDRTINVYE